ncbi:MAG: lipoyl synthase [Flavobacteriales bacterium]|nr:MAG: lipoyl synthase [Bacteroidota bacterium]KXK33393.1 MAG: Lipoate synthase [Chlorobi bacterium OLB6]MBE2264738.1 lipoyl synthase [Flavobacteriales bacterium]MBV6464645.1 Lipoyl synthase [Chlorobiota bacterium]MBW7853762.1 lipoyl synthase [Candidatus Kapabacteria bacterium]MCC6330363.1 lipoyl synthase [Ignavibacteria bacterium]
MSNQTTETPVPALRRPEWLKVKAPGGEDYARVKGMMRSKALHTVCEEARCPNITECWNAGTATFMIHGDTCTRSCSFCAVRTGRPLPVDLDEPRRVAEAVVAMKLQHAVVTSVNRDDLKDGGSEIWADTVRAIRALAPKTTIELLIPDFKNNLDNMHRVFRTIPDIMGHNTETVPRLYKYVRPQARYDWSLNVLAESKKAGLRTKTGIMLGLGETFDEVVRTMEDIVQIGVDVLTLGQYLQPTKNHTPVDRYVHPDEFRKYKEIGLEMGFGYVESGPLVRSSYHAERHV